MSRLLKLLLHFSAFVGAHQKRSQFLNLYFSGCLIHPVPTLAGVCLSDRQFSSSHTDVLSKHFLHPASGTGSFLVFMPLTSCSFSGTLSGFSSPQHRMLECLAQPVLTPLAVLS